ncbi:unnamed protein product [Rotaria sp. Silwood2]|nr:unnamed protein product [Rotaria sp. Silwood2]CAF3073441.1 unnamed protein product [Rotaria sp. Silwood2]CAF3396347.1 unnamed protein product [Rotaria sp. Silwood2]CAF4213397.1 unnamed protein product [Rotaria sp. Silwood2]CAF4335339.1 unnamed protein product [Rotaria sp. Silwood2]
MPFIKSKSQHDQQHELNHTLSVLPVFTPLNHYRYYHVNGSTSTMLLHSLIAFARKTTRYSIDTESDCITRKPSLIQIEFIQDESVVLLFEVHHLPHKLSISFWLIKSLFKIILNPKNMIFSWGNAKDELTNFLSFGLFSSAAIYDMDDFNIQNRFQKWYKENFKIKTVHPSPVIHEIISTYGNKSLKRSNFKWSLQMAIAYTFNEFHDKSKRMNNWSRSLDLRNLYIPSVVTTQEKKEIEHMIQYTIDDCLTVTKLVTVLKLDYRKEPFEKNYFFFDDIDADGYDILS